MVCTGTFQDASLNRGLADMLMLVTVDGKERTRDQWSHLLTSAGFQLKHFHPTRTPVSIIEALPAI